MYRISGNYVELIGSKGQKFYEIVAVEPRGIKIRDNADNGVEIVRIIPLNQIKR